MTLIRKEMMALEWISKFNPLAQFFHFSLKHGDSVESLMLLRTVNSAHRAPQVQSSVCMTHPEDRTAGAHVARVVTGTGPGT